MPEKIRDQVASLILEATAPIIKKMGASESGNISNMIGIVRKELSEENYQDWSVVVRNYLRGQGIWHNVVENIPESYPLKTTDEWQRNDAQALHAIQLACGSDNLRHISKCESAKDAWNKLQTSFAQEIKAKANQPPHGGGGKAEEKQRRHLVECVERGDVKAVKSCFEGVPKASSDLFSGNTNVIHVAVIGGNEEIVSFLLNRAPKRVLEREDDDGYTALALTAAFTGDKKIAEMLIDPQKGDPNLLGKKASKGIHQDLIPVVMAADMGHKDLTSFLYQQTLLPVLEADNYHYAALLFLKCIRSEIFDIALDLIQTRCRRLPLKHPEFDVPPLQALAQMPSAFPSGSQFRWWLQRWIYKNLRATSQDKSHPYITIKIISSFSSSSVDLIEPKKKISPGKLLRMLSKLAPLKILGELLRIFQNPLRRHCPAIERIYQRKLEHNQVLTIVSCMCERVKSTDTSEQLREISAYDAMLQAAKNGIIEFIQLMKNSKRELLWESIDQNNRGIFALAILHRRQEVFELMHELNGRRKKITCSKDDFGNNLLHLAATLGPSSDLDQRSGAALQMQRELQWFKAVEDNVHGKCKEEENDDGKKPKEVFAQSHKDLVKDAEKWAKDTASSFVIVGTLIITIIFAAAFTVPGGNDQNTGRPIFMKDIAFTTFVVADALALFTSSSSVLIFIGILTSRYAERDFLTSLPIKLLFGLLTLSISVITMFVAFCAAFFLMLQGYPSVTWTTLALALATVILILVPSQYRLFYQICSSTLGSKTFRSHKKIQWYHRLFHYANYAFQCCIGY